ncbi:hypothetical protein [Paenibacillus bouchesdurhonensis]|uniref:hypothetical protein n=1 Tax=Paenibacillus bouchesdurhonensis TaxID=1870990 RepID=UPI000DA5F230|nr:hypothetical protein [Paenibacillus bouchesdurhonensis]
MAIVIQAFRERFENYKRYEIGDEYPETNKERVKYLAKLGFIEVVGKPKRVKKGADANGDTDA